MKTQLIMITEQAIINSYDPTSLTKSNN